MIRNIGYKVRIKKRQIESVRDTPVRDTNGIKTDRGIETKFPKREFKKQKEGKLQDSGYRDTLNLGGPPLVG